MLRAPGTPGVATGKRVVLIGGGPASLACAAELRRHGVRAEIFDARPLPGGLNTYGIAEYKLPLAESLREIDLLTQLGVEFHFETVVNAEMLAELEAECDAVFLGLGLGAIHRLGVAGEELEGVTNALDFIAGYKSGTIQQVPSKVAVIGAGNTAIDAANAAVRLGASEVHMVYRRGPEQMSAFTFEYEHAKQEGVKFLWHVAPVDWRGRRRCMGWSWHIWRFRLTVPWCRSRVRTLRWQRSWWCLRLGRRRMRILWPRVKFNWSTGGF
jgi:dihydropyrimidine dehydrogenase (NAD+) subunit PreT